MWKHFKLEEFACSCGTCENGIVPYFVDWLDQLREFAGVPFVITSGYRCPEYDAQINGSGNHPTGRAVDISAKDSHTRYRIVEAAMKHGGVRIGIGGNFVHLDWGAEGERPVEVLWLY